MGKRSRPTTWSRYKGSKVYGVTKHIIVYRSRCKELSVKTGKARNLITSLSFSVDYCLLTVITDIKAISWPTVKTIKQNFKIYRKRLSREIMETRFVYGKTVLRTQV